MVNLRFRYYLRLSIILILIVFTVACATKYKLYEGDEFTFSAPTGYETKLYDPPYNGIGFEGSNPNSEMLLFSNVGHYPFFVIYRQEISQGGDLDTVCEAYMSKTSEKFPSYQFMSKRTITFNKRTAIEYVHCEYLGEPYVQSREIWMEHNGWAHSLVCVHSRSGLPCEEIPEPDQCVQIVEGFKFKE